MAFVTGLKAINALKEKADAQRSFSERPKIKYFGLKDGESKRVRFLQEIDEESPNFDADAGLAAIILQHQGPGQEGYKRKMQCTNPEDDGSPCLPCEIRKAQGWEAFPGKKSMLYVNVLVEPGTENEEVAVLNQSLFGNGIVQTLIEYASDADLGGSITDREWKISRSGVGKDTRYVATAYPAKEFDTKASDYELFPVSEAVAQVEYENQERFFAAVMPKVEEGRPAERKTAEKDFLEW